MLAVRDDGVVVGSVSGGCIEDDIVDRTRREGLKATKPEAVTYGVSADEGYLVSTIHRAENTDDPDLLRAIVDALASLPLPVLLLAHPRLVARCAGLPHGLYRADDATS